MGEFILDADARDSEGPVDTVLEFLQDTYSAAADFQAPPGPIQLLNIPVVANIDHVLVFSVLV
jgi:hypothetical protein